MERFYMGLRNVKPPNLPIPNLQTFKPYAPNMLYTIDIMVCQAKKAYKKIKKML
jgi:hypothetical protein